MGMMVRFPLLLALTLTAVTLHAQESQVSVEVFEPPNTPSAAGTYRIGLQDELKVTVFDEPELSTIYRVDSDGAISFPLIGHITAAGASISELQQRIASMLAAGDTITIASRFF
jgi:polysaccharide export outer membrane protein